MSVENATAVLFYSAPPTDRQCHPCKPWTGFVFPVRKFELQFNLKQTTHSIEVPSKDLTVKFTSSNN